MAKKTEPRLRDRLPNRAYVVVAWGAATTTAVVTTIQTLMGSQEGLGWLISRFDVQPRSAVPFVEEGPGGMTLKFQVSLGAQAGLLAADDPKVVGTVDRVSQIETQGGTLHEWPLTWIGPVLVASRELTCGIDGSVNQAPYQSADMLFTIWYQNVKLSDRDWLEIAQAQGGI